MSESTEMYLETILILKERNGYVRSIDLAHEMHYSKPTISQQMKRLKEKGLIEIDEKGHITTAGTKTYNIPIKIGSFLLCIYMI